MLQPDVGADFSPGLRACVDQARRVAGHRGAPEVTPADLLIAVVQSGGEIATALRELGAQPEAVIQSAWSRLAQMPPAAQPPVIGEAAQRVLEDTSAEARLLSQHPPVRLHLLAALAYRTSGAAYETLEEAHVTLVDLRLFAQRLAREAAGPRGGAPGQNPPGRSGGSNVVQLPRRAPNPRHATMRPSPVILVPIAAFVLGGFGLWSGVSIGLVRWFSMLLFVLGGWILTICVHEFSHAITAYWGGDRSVLASGYLTWNPLRYVNPVFSIVIPLVFILLGGIGFPGGAIFFDPRNLRHRGWQTAVALAGPAGTVVCFVILAAPFWSGLWTRVITDQTVYLWAGLAALSFLQIAILILNLLPLPPLDGWGAIAPYVSRSLQYTAMRYGTFIILGLFLLLWIPGINQVAYG
ncbi:MAG: hypothetical protein J2P44_05875, partial [Candidatus Dormibacteraeota bacterium]|nr:hypothetical protein [Candidatus Dormibacteraeota bacterium]